MHGTCISDLKDPGIKTTLVSPHFTDNVMFENTVAVPSKIQQRVVVQACTAKRAAEDKLAEAEHCIAEMKRQHEEEVQRLTAERDSAVQRAHALRGEPPHTRFHR